MTLLSLGQVERRFGERVVFSDVSLRIDAKDRIGLIGDNGAGKTTLLRILTGEDAPDLGQRHTRRDLVIAWTTQIPVLEPGATVLSTVQQAFHELEGMETELRALEAAMAESADERLLHRHERIHDAFAAAGGYHRERLAERSLLGLGFEPSDLGKPIEVLSGGEKARVALARVMLAPCDLLILDEPTNHLDLDGVAFLEDWLLRRQGAFVVVSHDRRFLDRVCTSIAELEACTLRRWRGNYTAYREQKEREALTALREFEKQQDWVAKEMDYIRRNMAGRMSAQAKGRLKRLQRLQILAKPRGDGRAMRLRLGKAKGLPGQCVIEAEGVAMGFGDRQLFEGLDFKVWHGDRVGLVAKNGAGKSTLLAIAAGRLLPQQGRVERSKMLSLGWFDQEMADLPRTGSVLSSFMSLVPQWTEGECRDWLARFEFQGDDVDQEVAALSGGEKRRLCLARLLVSPCDVYLLDEPTNHLDIATRESLEEAILDFDGTVFLVSHDRWFLRQVCTRVFELRRDRVIVHEGGIDAYEASRAAARREAAASDESERARPAGEPRPSAAKPAAPGKVRNPFAFAKLEASIFALEEELAQVQKGLTADDLWKQPEQLKTLQKRRDAIQAELGPLYEQWESWG